jgi:predicted acetylornithine/succinylornithine family transaminase
MNTYARFPLTLVRGEGMYVWDENNRKYLDFMAGIAVNSLGHAHKKLAGAIARQAEMLIHVSNLYWTPAQVALAQKLVANSCFDKVFFCNSGAEAIEGALKLARKYSAKRGEGRIEIIAMRNSFHGRTFGAVTATGQTKYQRDLSPLLPGIVHADYNSFESVAACVTDKTAAVLIEPVQGEGGIIPAKPEFLKSVRRLCDERGILLIYDEVQCGAGRTGYLFAFERYGAEPDVAVLAKGLAGGVPIGVLLARGAAAEGFSPGDHASTFGGNSLAAAAANVVLDELLTAGSSGHGSLLDNVKRQGEYLTQKLRALAAVRPCVTDVRGFGLMQGIELSTEAAPIISKCIDSGLLLVSAGPSVIRFVPPLIVNEKDIDEAAAILEDCM